ncbi:MAG: hypothetical protein LBC20_07620 [Planctomycetaceae bacterium]|jgi:hypothetical protein|nr:hypothetical protein [Planctomycetaceae bacterium]
MSQIQPEPNSLNFTAFQFSRKSAYDAYTEKIALVKVVKETIIERLSIPIDWVVFPEPSSNLGECWNEIISFVGNGILACFDRRTARELNYLLSGYNIDYSDFRIIEGKKLIEKEKVFDKSEYISYKDAAEKFGLSAPHLFNAEEKAEFTVALTIKLSDNIEMFSIESLFQTERDSTYKKKGSPKVFRVSVDDLLKRPPSTRFQGTYFAFTGKLQTETHPKIERKDAIEMVETMGGIATDKIELKVTHLVVGVQTGIEHSRKEQNAAEDGKILVTATDFFKLIEID